MKKYNNEYEPDIIDSYPTPLDFLKQCLYIRKRNNERCCMYKNVKIDLTPRLFDALFMLAEDTSKTHQIDSIDRPNGATLDSERQIASRINKAFKKEGFNENIVIKERGAGYRINLNVIPDDFVVVAHK